MSIRNPSSIIVADLIEQATMRRLSKQVLYGKFLMKISNLRRIGNFKFFVKKFVKLRKIRTALLECKQAFTIFFRLS